MLAGNKLFSLLKTCVNNRCKQFCVIGFLNRVFDKNVQFNTDLFSDNAKYLDMEKLFRCQAK
jgi:hypothetical protein